MTAPLGNAGNSAAPSVSNRCPDDNPLCFDCCDAERRDLHAEVAALRKQLNVAKSNAGSHRRERDEARERVRYLEGIVRSHGELARG